MVTRNGRKVWEVAAVTTVREHFAKDNFYATRVSQFGGEDAAIYLLKNPGQRTKGQCWWSEAELAPAE